MNNSNSEVGISLGLAVLAVFSACLCASAKTTTWTGGATGNAGTAKSFTDSANWDNGVPAPGDTVVINCSSAWNNPVYIGHEAGSTDTAETFDMGSAGLTFDISSSYTKLLVNFTGSGRIVKTGVGMLGFACESAFTGGIEVRDGKVESWVGNKRLSVGTGTVEFIADGTTPGVGSDAYGSGFMNAFSFSGDDSDYVAYDGGQLFLVGSAMSSTHDLTFKPSNGGVRFYGPISAHGHTITLWSKRATASSVVSFELQSSVDASLVAKGNQKLTLSGSSPNPENSLEIQDGMCQIDSSAFWGGTNIALSGTTTNLTLNGSGNLSSNAAITIAPGCPARIFVENSAAVRVRTLSVRGTAIAEGVYDAGTLPGVISGSGVLLVGGTAGKRTTWIGPVTGGSINSSVDGTPQSLFDASNWDNGVPVAGDTIVITNAGAWNKEVYIGTGDGAGEDAFDLGTVGLTVETTLTSTRVRFGIPFTGEGRIVKLGPGYLGAEVDSSHAGGTLIAQGAFESYKQGATLSFGTGLIDFLSPREDLIAPRIGIDPWGCTLANDLAFSGSSGVDTVIVAGQSYTFNGNITAEHDLFFRGTYGEIKFNRVVSAPGKTITVNGDRANDDSYAPNFTFNGTVVGSIVKTGNKTMSLKAPSGAIDDTLTVNGGTVAIAAAASWCGTNVVVNSGAAALALNGAGNLAPGAVVRIATTGGAKINIASGVKVCVSELWVDGVSKEIGIYNASNLPSAISGAGRLVVGKPGCMVIVF